MFYKNIIFDLDDTLYNYNTCNDIAMNKVYEHISTLKNIKKNEIEKIYKNIDLYHKNLTINTASSHNKYIKIKQLLEKINIDNFQDIHKLYWSSFYSNIKLNNNTLNFILWNKKLGIKIGILTDYETEYQIEKLKKLNILKYIDCIVTSEEIGCEKPSVHAFNYILMKMNANRNETIMIGDNFQKDILGANSAGIYAYHYTNLFQINDKYTNFSTFKELHTFFIYIHNELTNLKNISRFCGERFDLVQAGGGNTSVKLNNLMFIKASGYNLSNITLDKGYVCINNKKLLRDLSNNELNSKITFYNMYGNLRGSIETYMHSILKKYTIHLHPIQVNKILILKNSKNIIKKLFPNSLIIDYFTPGLKVYSEINKLYSDQEIIFLDNHGVIITTNDFNNIKNIINNIINNCEAYLNFDCSKYKLTNKITNFIFQKYNKEIISYLSEDIIITEYIKNNISLFKENITMPDALVYCGIQIVIGNLEDINKYYETFKELPKIIIINKSLFIISNSLKKCKEIEDVLKANLFILDTTEKKQYLSQDEICFLNNWDAEKYRQLL